MYWRPNSDTRPTKGCPCKARGYAGCWRSSAVPLARCPCSVLREVVMRMKSSPERTNTVVELLVSCENSSTTLLSRFTWRPCSNITGTGLPPVSTVSPFRLTCPLSRALKARARAEVRSRRSSSVSLIRGTSNWVLSLTSWVARSSVARETDQVIAAIRAVNTTSTSRKLLKDSWVPRLRSRHLARLPLITTLPIKLAARSGWNNPLERHAAKVYKQILNFNASVSRFHCVLLDTHQASSARKAKRPDRRHLPGLFELTDTPYAGVQAMRRCINPPTCVRCARCASRG